jgi:hypothetical protein
MNGYHEEIFVKSWILSGSAKEEWGSFVHDLGSQVIEADRQRLFR